MMLGLILEFVISIRKRAVDNCQWPTLNGESMLAVAVEVRRVLKAALSKTMSR